MGDAKNISARFEDLLLTITRHESLWRARVGESDDPTSALSDGTDYVSPERAKRGAVTIAHELFGTNVPEEELEWQATEESSDAEGVTT